MTLGLAKPFRSRRLAEGLRHFLAEQQQIREIPKGQRFAGRLALEKYSQRKPWQKAARSTIAKAISEFGDSQTVLYNQPDTSQSETGTATGKQQK